MRSFTVYTFLCIICCAMMFPHYSTTAQTQEDPLPISNRLSVSAGYGTVMGSIGFPVWSAMYSRTIVPHLEAEVSIFNGANSYFRSDDLTHTIVSPNYYNLRMWNLTNIDISLLWKPSAAQHGLRLGLGGTLQHTTLGGAETYQGGIGKAPPDSLLRVYPPSFYQYSTSWVLGAHLTADYIVPLSNVVDAGFRLKGYVLFWRLEPANVQVFSSGVATANVFIGVRF